MNTAIFFDINGTIIKRDARTDIPYSNAVNSLLNASNAMEGVDTSARSDKDVFLEVLGKYNESFHQDKWDAFMRLYVHELEQYRESDIWRPNADAVPFVRSLHEKGYPLALITGELSVGAEYKLKKLDVWQYFLTGGYGEDGLKRFEIADSAKRKLLERVTQTVDEYYVIGDTVLDIQTARHLGAKSIAITTGSHSKEKLLSENPDYCIDTFQEIHTLFL